MYPGIHFPLKNTARAQPVYPGIHFPLKNTAGVHSASGHIFPFEVYNWSEALYVGVSFLMNIVNGKLSCAIDKIRD